MLESWRTKGFRGALLGSYLPYLNPSGILLLGRLRLVPTCPDPSFVDQPLRRLLLAEAVSDDVFRRVRD